MAGLTAASLFSGQVEAPVWRAAVVLNTKTGGDEKDLKFPRIKTWTYVGDYKYFTENKSGSLNVFCEKCPQEKKENWRETAQS